MDNGQRHHMGESLGYRVAWSATDCVRMHAYRTLWTWGWENARGRGNLGKRQ